MEVEEEESGQLSSAEEDEDDTEPEDGVPWYLFDGEANALQGTRVDEISSIPYDAVPPPCSDELVCLLMRIASLDQKFRTERISIKGL